MANIVGSQERSSTSIAGASHHEALGKICVALEEAGVETSLASAFAMLELGFLSLRSAGVPLKAVESVVAALGAFYEGSPEGGSSRAN
jgi:hypothetical protein